MPDSARDDPFIRAGTLAELDAKGKLVTRGGPCALLVVRDGARVFAVDNRCPHLGFPLHRGSVEDGILTCHWHHARFDLCTGGTFDLWADDLPTAPVALRGGEVWVAAQPRYADGEAHWRNRLRAGLEQNIGLVIAKAVLGLTAQGSAARDIAREAVLFGVSHRDEWGSGLTTLTALANLVPSLPEEETYLALYSGLARVAEDCENAPARRDRPGLGTDAHDTATLTRWLRHWTAVRHRDAAERTLRTAIVAGAEAPALAEMLLVAVTDRAFADGGHALDFINKAFEATDLVGWDRAADILPATVNQLVTARGAEESNSWRHPVDLIALCRQAAEALPATFGSDAAPAGLTETLLGDDPAAATQALVAALRDGSAPTALSRTLAYAAALRVARFGTANEFSDWDSAHHCFTYCNGLHRLLVRIAAAGRPVPAEALRGLLHGAMRVYLLRFLNVPPAPIPTGTDDNLPRDAEALREAFLVLLDRYGAVDEAGRLVGHYLALGHPVDLLVATLARAVLREDAGFHTYQMLEAGMRQQREWGLSPEGRHVLIAVARYVAAHSPTERARLQTATVARKLARGQAVHESEG